ncbi:RNA polymerase sigma factor [Lysobacter enzymogenes]|uniref:Sigma-70 family RNA polymerase sigma factor n=1 Tax=Lysobacter enzymogenes TaxID=69 RepID=A0A3N2RK61_LYSEN|nr:sigma-70 family RNA polymerase sigma factor [Lysobacter enzymogenes]ROU07761.1 sigma-70 family RNA polymerase sigma factor [Lysobacter enzymogenes]
MDANARERVDTEQFRPAPAGAAQGRGTAGGPCADFKLADQMFTEAWRSNLPELEARARRFAEGQRDRAEELLGNAAIKALLFMRRAPHTITDPGGFLFVVLRHVFLDSVRQRSRDREVFDRHREVDGEGGGFAHEGLSALQKLELEEQLERVVAAVARMSRKQRRLFAYRFVEELPYPVIAERLQMNQPLARKHVELLRNRLRVAVGRE